MMNIFPLLLLLFAASLVGCAESRRYTMAVGPQGMQLTANDKDSIYKHVELNKQNRDDWMELTSSLSSYRISHSSSSIFARTIMGDSFDNSEILDRLESEQLFYELAAVMAETGMWSTVSVLTDDPGARVEYQLIGRGVVNRSLTFTNDVEIEMPIGIYDFRVYRNGQVTGKLAGVRIIRKEETLELDESLIGN